MRFRAMRITGAVLVALILYSTGALCQEEKPFPKNRIVYSNLLTFRLNPLGLMDILKVGYRYRLYENPAPLFKDAHIGISFEPMATPVVYKLGGTLTIKPLSVLSFYGGYHFVHWMGNMGFMQSFDSVESDYSETALDTGEENGDNYSVRGAQAHLGAHVIGKVGPIIAGNNLTFYYTDLNLHNGDTLFYTPAMDALAAQKGWFLTNDTDVFYLFDFGLLVGLRNSVIGTFYEDNHYAAGTGDNYTYADRLGPILVWILKNKPGALFDRPSFILVVNWYLKHQYRTGAESHQAIPYFVLGFKFEGQLWGRN